jgi:hypothetical protein
MSVFDAIKIIADGTVYVIPWNPYFPPAMLIISTLRIVKEQTVKNRKP